MRFSTSLFLVGYLLAVLFSATGFSDEHLEGGKTAATRGERAFHILKDLPDGEGAYQAPAAALVKQGIPEKYGHEEWAAVVLTNEIHQHVGIYTILGAKMGVRAREILQAPPRTVMVTVETGAKPPLSCLIDGLQVALGSTYAQGLIHAPACENPQVAAVFEYKGKKIRLSLNPKVRRHIDMFIANTIKECGDLTPAYFEKIEANSYSVWAEMDRKAIFVEEQ